MTLQETIDYHREMNKEGIVASPEKIPEISIQEIIDEALRGNVHLSMVFSDAIDRSEKEFLVAAFGALEYDHYDISDGFGNYTITEYSYEAMIKELSIQRTKELLKERNITAHYCKSILKLREKDELTFLIKTNTQHIFVSEIFWWS